MHSWYFERYGVDMGIQLPVRHPVAQPKAKLSTGRIISAPGRVALSEVQSPLNSSVALSPRQSVGAPFFLGLVFATSAAFGALHSNYGAQEDPETDVAQYEAALDSDSQAQAQGSIHAQAKQIAQQYLDASYDRAVYVESAAPPTQIENPEPHVRLLAVSAKLTARQTGVNNGKSAAAALSTYRPELPKSSSSALTQRVLKIIQLHHPKHTEAKPLAERIVRESLAQDYDPLFVAAVIKSESGFNALARSHVGARGLMQIMPKTGAYLADKLNVKKLQLYDRDQNLKLGIAFLKELEAGYGGDKVMTLVAYNWGPGHVELAGKGKRRIPGEVMRYAVKILNDYRRWRGEVPPRSAIG